MEASQIGLLVAVVAAAFVLGVVVGRLSARFAVQVRRDPPVDHVSHERLVQLRRM